MFQDSLVVKIFIFQFVNSYASFFFIAFIAGNLSPTPDQNPQYLGQCGWVNCMQPLSVNLAIIFGSRLTITNALDILIPMYNKSVKLSRETKGKDLSALTPPERDYMLMESNSMLDGIQCFADTAIQFGFTVLFITALPVATFFSLMSNYLKVKIQSYKLTRLYQRPVPQGCQDIGTWQDIFKIISVVSVATNAAIICFTMDVLTYDSAAQNSKISQVGGLSARANFSLVGRLWVFFGFCVTLIFFQFLLTLAIPDVPLEVQIQHERQEFIVSKAIKRLQDEDYSELMDMADELEAKAEQAAIVRYCVKTLIFIDSPRLTFLLSAYHTSYHHFPHRTRLPLPPLPHRTSSLGSPMAAAEAPICRSESTSSTWTICR